MACAVGRKVDYATPTDLGLSGNGLRVTVAVLDHRPYVISGEKEPAFVGLQRSGFGIPFDVSTESGRWLSEDFSDSIAQSLSAKGYQVKELALDPAITNEAAIGQAVLTGSDRAAILEITEWKTDTAARAALYHGLLLDVYDQAGSRISREQISGRDNLGGSIWDIDPAASAAQVAREAFKRKIGELFNAPEIKPALTAASEQPAS
jgi:hypothetical protein